MNHNFDEKTVTRTINPESRFVLIGNKIDGSINFNIHIFKNFSEVKENLESILLGIEGNGEWDVILYQIKENFKINYQYGYYRVPNYGKKIFTYSYMHGNLKQIIFKPNMIIFFHANIFFPNDKYYITKDDRKKTDLWVEIRKIKLLII